MDIHAALKWRAIWPLLQALPSDAPLAALDAGCGNGAWCRRLARLRPKWRVVGLDKDPLQVAEGRRLEESRSLGNLTYMEGDFLNGITGRYDVILSIASVHYAAAQGYGVEVLRSLANALAPQGVLILLVPRQHMDQPLWRGLPQPAGWPVFAPEEVVSMATQAGLAVRDIQGLFGRWCLLGKQIAMWGESSLLKRVATSPLQMLVRATPFDLFRDPRRKSYALILVATRR